VLEELHQCSVTCGGKFGPRLAQRSTEGGGEVWRGESGDSSSGPRHAYLATAGETPLFLKELIAIFEEDLCKTANSKVLR